MGHREGKGVFVNRDSELEAFKREMDLRQLAVGLGYEMDRRESWRGSTVPRRRRNVNLGAVRQILRPWIGGSATPPRFPALEPTSTNRMRVECAYRRMAHAQRYPYLERERCVPAAVLLSPRFAGRMRIDSRGNTVFPHFDAAGLCGYEIENRGFTGFAAGGQKGMWFSHARPDDRRLVLAESAIDALSHAAPFPDAEDQTRYASLGGNPSSRQTGLVQAAIARLPEGAGIVAAFDADAVGRKLVDVIREAVASVASRAERTDLIFKAHLAVKEGEDWNLVPRNGGMVLHPASQV